MEEKLDTRQERELAEGVIVHYQPAGPFLRFLAYILDFVATIVIVIILGTTITFVGGTLETDDGMENIIEGLWLLIMFLVWYLYPVLFEAGEKGATFGKRACKLRVVNLAGTRITLGQAAARNFIRSAEILMPILPLTMFFNKRFQRPGDLAADTLVVYTLPPERASSPILSGNGEDPVTPVPIPIPLDRDEQAAILAFRNRSARWSINRQEELAAHLDPLLQTTPEKAVSRLRGMARWLTERS